MDILDTDTLVEFLTNADGPPYYGHKRTILSSIQQGPKHQLFIPNSNTLFIIQQECSFKLLSMRSKLFIKEGNEVLLFYSVSVKRMVFSIGE